ncbi:MAG TPA: NAD(P)-dependent oxidoreductase [Stellaceae bacterium]|nr:NAD(P)-dependent oxidoreductase [Stellaceae bacterium]
MTKPSLGIVGLGQMGRHIAANLLRTGWTVLASGRNAETLAALRERGVETTSDNGDLARCDLVFLCLPNGGVVHEVLLGPGGLAAAMRPGQTIVDLSTIDHGTTIKVAEALAARGIDFLDAPISGMETRAADGTLTVMCGGPEPVFEAVKPILDHIGKTILHMGPSGSGQLAKLINQLLFDVNAAALAEALPMAVRMGLDPDKVAAVINSGTGRSHASEFFLPRILRGRFSDGYPMRHAYKDLVGASELGARLCIPMPVLAAATATYQTALLRGHGELDKGGMVRVFESLLGVEFRSPSQPKTEGEHNV